MAIDRHVTAHFDFFDHLVAGDRNSAATYGEFCEEDRSGAEYRFCRQPTPWSNAHCRKATHAMPVKLAAHSRLGMLAVEDKNDDISGPAGQDLCQTLSQWMKANSL
jgi:poly(3-hydroxybutyrate) depolymerase